MLRQLNNEAKSERYTRRKSAKQVSVQERASAPKPQVEQKSIPLAAEFALEGQETVLWKFADAHSFQHV